MPITERFLLENKFQITDKGHFMLQLPSPIQGVEAVIVGHKLGDIRVARLKIGHFFFPRNNNIKTDDHLRKIMQDIDEIVIREESKPIWKRVEK